MSDETTLLPCPICGGQPDFQHFNITPNVKGRIICACGLSLVQGKNDTADDMRIIWNTRTPEQAIAATMGCGECELAEVDSYKDDRETIHVLECSACGETCEHVNGSYPRCPHCGRKAVKHG